MAGQQAVLIAGPTASGKTRLAVAMARATGAMIVNADSMQVYDGLSVVTARPEADDLAAAPHRLFGMVDPATRFSTGAWLTAAQAILQEARDANRSLIFVGGTGLYFDALTKGFAQIPPVPHAMIQDAEAEIAGLDGAGRQALLAHIDPDLAAQLGVVDPQRLVRAISVLRATGQRLSAYAQAQSAPLLGEYALERMVLMPERRVLRARIATRFEAMMAQGAVEEVEALLARGLDPSLPAMKAIGVPEIAAYLAGAISRHEAISRAVTASRQYAKRQSTWFRNRMGDWRFVDPDAP